MEACRELFPAGTQRIVHSASVSYCECLPGIEFRAARRSADPFRAVFLDRLQPLGVCLVRIFAGVSSSDACMENRTGVTNCREFHETVIHRLPLSRTLSAYCAAYSTRPVPRYS